MNGLQFDSLADLPPKAREQVAGKLLAQKIKGNSVADSAPTRTKYGNQKATVEGITFDSQKEAKRYLFLLHRLKAGAICDLKLQHDFTLQEAYTTAEGERIRAIRYRADFTYKEADTGQFVVEDVKSRATKTKDYIIKKKLMAERGYLIREV